MEPDLVARAAAGNVDAFEVLVRRSSNRLYAIAYRILRDEYLAEDALQLALMTMWNHLPMLRDRERFEAWSYRLIVRASIEEAKRRRRHSILRLNGTRPEPGSPGNEMELLIDRDRLERGFKRLTPEQRAVLVLHHYAGLSLVEISETLGIPPGTTASRIHYSVRALRAALEADERPAIGTERLA
jgi:RNA polymerase sigma-70 factor (ECF subfamily)